MHWSAFWNAYWTQWFVGNVLPPSLWTLVGIGLAHVNMRKHVSAKHEELKAHVSSELKKGSA